MDKERKKINTSRSKESEKRILFVNIWVLLTCCVSLAGFFLKSRVSTAFGAILCIISTLLLYSTFYRQDKLNISNSFVLFFLFCGSILLICTGLYICEVFFQASSTGNLMLFTVFLIISQFAIVILCFSEVVKVIRATNVGIMSCFSVAILVFHVIEAFALVYSILLLFDNKAILGVNSASSPTIYLDMLYFSTVTFTTLGYGDLVPNNSAAKLTVIIEVFMFVVVFSFILVNLVRKRRD